MVGKHLLFVAIAVVLTTDTTTSAKTVQSSNLRVHVRDYDAYCASEGESPMSVEGVEGTYCVEGQACSGEYRNGACPGPQDGLQWGSYCGKVVTGEYGCVPYESAAAMEGGSPMDADATENTDGTAHSKDGDAEIEDGDMQDEEELDGSGAEEVVELEMEGSGEVDSLELELELIEEDDEARQ